MAFKSLLIMCFFIIFASLLAPDVLDIWASTQKNDFRRDLAKEWSDSVGEISRNIKINEIREFSERLIEGSSSEELLEPLVKPVLTLNAESSSMQQEALDEKDIEVKETEEKSTQSSIENSTLLSPSSTTLLPPSSTTLSTATTAVTVTTTTTFVDSEPFIKARRKGTPEEPLRILAVGDSLMLDFQYGLERILEPRPDVKIEGRGALGFGFTVPHWDWEDDVIPDYNLMVGKVRPDVVVVMIGANEFQGYAIEGEDLESGSFRWSEVLTERAHDAISHWIAGGAYLYWYTTPKMSDPSYLTVDLNNIWDAVVSDWHPKAEMVDSMKVLGDEEGEFRWNMEMLDGSIIPLRKEHGVHFFEVGADGLSRQFEEILEKDGWLKDLMPVS
ncbi:MAG: hypothetical protein QGI12_05905 [Acidimicrobiales bacterium]|nr:hypothetical protein [Acidimicrobiales bacterium]